MNWVDTITLGLGIILSLYFSYSTWKKGSLYLGMFFLTYVGILFKVILPEIDVLSKVLSQLTWLVGPLIYFFATGKRNAKPIDLLHAIPFIACVTLIFFNEALTVDRFNLNFMLPPLVRFGHSIIYVLLAAFEVKNGQRFKWIILSVSILLTVTYAAIFNFLGIMAVSFSIPVLLLIVGYLCHKFLSEINIIKSADDDELESLQHIFLKVLDSIEDEQLFLNQNLKISDLTAKLKVTDKVISKAINTIAQENFNAFINRYRVKYATDLINSEKYSYYTIAAIAEEVGFSNKVSFYKAFKRIETVSPSKYRENAQKRGTQATETLPP